MASVYLAGPIRDTNYQECTSWREYAKEKLAEDGIVGVSPMRGKEYLKNEAVIKGEYKKYPLSTGPGITCRDRFDVMRCDALLINVLGAQKISIGTIIEIGWADAFRKPIVLIIEFVAEFSFFLSKLLLNSSQTPNSRTC